MTSDKSSAMAGTPRSGALDKNTYVGAPWAPSGGGRPIVTWGPWGTGPGFKGSAAKNNQINKRPGLWQTYFSKALIRT